MEEWVPQTTIHHNVQRSTVYFQIGSKMVKSIGSEDNNYSILDNVTSQVPSIKITFD